MSRWTELLERIIAGETEDQPPFIEALNFPAYDRWERGRVWMTWEIDPAVFHPGGAVFGGYIAALADYVLGPAAWTVMDTDDDLTTSNLQVSFFRPVMGKTLAIEGRVVNKSRRMVHVEATFTRDDGKLAAVATATQVLVPERGQG